MMRASQVQEGGHASDDEDEDNLDGVKENNNDDDDDGDGDDKPVDGKRKSKLMYQQSMMIGGNQASSLIDSTVAIDGGGRFSGKVKRAGTEKMKVKTFAQLNREMQQKVLKTNNSLQSVMEWIDEKVEVSGMPESIVEAMETC